MFVRKSRFLELQSMYGEALKENTMLWKLFHSHKNKPVFKGGAWRKPDGRFAGK